MRSILVTQAVVVLKKINWLQQAVLTRLDREGWRANGGGWTFGRMDVFG